MTRDEDIRVIEWEDIGYTAVVFVHEHWAEITVHQIVGEGEHEGRRILLYKSKETEYYDTPDVAASEEFFEGSIKWDGCSNWDFYTTDGVMKHFCERKQAINCGELFSRLYDLGRDLIPSADQGAFD